MRVGSLGGRAGWWGCWDPGYVLKMELMGFANWCDCERHWTAGVKDRTRTQTLVGQSSWEAGVGMDRSGDGRSITMCQKKDQKFT